MTNTPPPPPRNLPKYGGRLYTCKACGARGHNARTCGQNKEQREASRRGVKP